MMSTLARSLTSILKWKEGRHVEALQKANLAIEFLSSKDDDGLSCAPVLVTGEPSTSLLAIAYHNQAVELNWLQRPAEAIIASERAVEVPLTICGVIPIHHSSLSMLTIGPVKNPKPTRSYGRLVENRLGLITPPLLESKMVFWMP